jgi:hypothetical protein
MFSSFVNLLTVSAVSIQWYHTFACNMLVQSNFDERVSLQREKAYTREVFYAFCFVTQAEYATFSGIIL